MALDETQVSQAVAAYIEKRKSHRQKVDRYGMNHITKEPNDAPRYPEYWEGYNICADMYDAIRPHVDPNYYPVKLFEKRAPNETKDQAEFMRANYRPVTIPVFEDFKATITRAFADQNWNITYKGETDDRFGDDTFEEYVNHGIKNFGSLELFMKSMLPTLKIADPNGIIAIYPEDVPTTEIDGEEVFSNDLVEPQPYYYSCKRIVGKTDDYFMVVSQYTSLVKEGKKVTNDGEVLLLFDDENIWKIEQTGKKSDFVFGEPQVMYNHGEGQIPCKVLMGTPVLYNNNVLYQSVYITAIPLLDQVLLDNSYLGLIKARSTFPFIVAVGDICEFEQDGNKCNDGQIYNPSTGNYSTCPSCNGAGMKSRFSASGTMLIRPKTSLSDGDTGLSGEYLKFVSPPLDTNKFLREEIDTNLLKSRGILHINNSDQAVQGNEAQTATGSMNKMRSLYAFIKPQSDQMFYIFEWMNNTIGYQRYGEYYGGVNVVYPTTFDIVTPSDYLSMIKGLTDAGAPPSIIYATVINYLRSINYTDKETDAIYNLIGIADDLLTMPSADIALRVANGTIEAWRDVLHHSAPQLIQELMREFAPTEEYNEFLDLPINEQVDALIEKAQSRTIQQDDAFTRLENQIINFNANNRGAGTA